MVPASPAPGTRASCPRRAVGPGAVAAALGGHGGCPAACPKGFPQGFLPHTLTSIWFPLHIETQPPLEQLSGSCCHPKISTKSCFQQHLPGVWSHSRVPAHPACRHLPCFKPHSAGKLKCRRSGLIGWGWWRIVFPLSGKCGPAGEREPTRLSKHPPRPPAIFP